MDSCCGLQQCGLPACAISNTVGQDVERRIVYLRAITFEPDCVVLRLSEREMAIPYGALLVIVRGEVHVGRSHHLSSTSGASSSIRPAASAVGLLSSSGGTGEYVRETACVGRAGRLFGRGYPFRDGAVDCTN